MKTIHKYIVLSLLLFALSACEVVFDMPSDDSMPKIVVNALANPDTNFVVYLNRSIFLANVVPPLYPFEENDQAHSSFRLTNINHANVYLTVNESNPIKMIHDLDNLYYSSDYIPQEGDRIVVDVNATGFESVRTETVVPKRAKVDIIDYEIIYSKYEIIPDDWNESFMDDSLIVIKIKIFDQGDSENYYRLKIRSIYHIDYGTIGWMETVRDLFYSSDILFRDDRLTRSYRRWPARFTNIFNDHLFDGKEYEFTVETQKKLFRVDSRVVISPSIVVDLQSISKEYYHYLNSLMLYRITNRDSYSEAVHIYSNIEDGYGIFGSVSSVKDTTCFNYFGYRYPEE